MTETVTLQWYLKNLNDMLERESPTEVVSHCRYILQRFPQNVETYRLLGKALLQKGHSEELQTHFDEAAEVFLRVLSVLPGDYISHLGMSEIREQTKALDQAIWHMERAYEQMPGNAMLQEGLRRLYAKRHGEGQAAAKIHLTRGALARQYMQAHLYEQALTELRGALDQSPQRIDLEVLLAETLWESQHPVEAGEVAVQILKKLPNCLPALRILAQLWLNYERPTDAQVYLERIEALDPYEAIRLVHPGINVSDTIRLPRLDYSAKAAAALSSETPDWVEELGDISDMQDVFQPSAAFPPPSAPPTPPKGPDRIDTDAIFGASLADAPDWFGGQAADFPSPDLSQVFPDQPRATDEPPELASSEIPDWFAEVVNAGPAPAPSDTPSVEADWLSFAEEELFASAEQIGEPPAQDEPLERPSSGFTDLLQGIERSQAVVDEFNAQLDDIEPVAPEWLSSFDQVSEAPLPAPDMMAWFNEELPAETTSGEPEKLDAVGEAFSWDAPDDFASAQPTDEVPSGDIEALFSEQDEPAWLSDQEEQAGPVTPEELEALRQASMPPEDLSEFFLDEESAQSQEEAGIHESAGSEPGTGPTDDWLAEFEAFDEAEFSAVLATAEPPREEMPAQEEPADDWLAEVEALDEVEFSAEYETAELPATPTEEEPAEDWLAEVEALDEVEFSAEYETAELPATPTEEEPAEDWLAEVEAFGEAEFGAELGAAEAPTAPAEEESAEDWLAEVEAFDEAEFSAALAAAETPIEEISAEELLPDFEVSESVEGVSELPDWVKAAAPVGVQSDELPQTADAAPLDEDLLSFFDTAQEQFSAPTDQAAFEADPEVANVLDFLAPETDQDDWLASFAKPQVHTGQAEQPVSEESFAETWLADSESVQHEELSLGFDAEEAPVESEIEIQELEPPFETIEAAADQEVVEIEAAPSESWLSEVPAVGDESPAWLSDIEPISAPPVEVSEALVDDSYDPFAAERADQVPAYESAQETGVLQPFEEPDWMAAFSDEEMPAEIDSVDEIEEAVPFALLDFEGGESSIVDEEQAVTASLADFELENWDAAEVDFPEALETTAEEPASAGDDEGMMPDWLAAITSEAEKLDESFFEETAESYGSVEETGVLQPGSRPDWLVDLEPDQESVEPETTAIDDFFQLDEGTPAEFPAGIPEIDDFFLPSDQFDTAEFEIEAAAARGSEVRDEVAQRGDLAHTSEDVMTEDWDEELVPGDFSFDDQPPAWLRRPKELDPDSDQADYGRPPEAPEWLRDVFEDDDQ